MELVEGETLEARVRRQGPLPVSLALEVATQVARALVAAEVHGLVHRDLKPGNLMVLNSDPGGADAPIVKVIDFGLAKAVVEVADAPDQTHPGFSGTPDFASPEQFSGNTPLDVRSDIYSLGATLWYLLAGRVPFAGRVASEPGARPPDQPLPMQHLAAAKMPAPLMTLLRSMLAANPAGRPQSARELLAALQRFRATAEMQPRRRRLLKLAALTFAIGLAAIGLTNYFFPQRLIVAAPEKSLAVLPFENLSKDQNNAFFAAGIQDDVLTSLSRINDLKLIGRTSVMSYRDTAGRNLREIGQALGVTNLLEGSVRGDGNAVRVNVRLVDARSQQQRWAASYNRTLADSLTLQPEVAQEIAGALRVALSPPEKASLETKPTENPDAYLLYLRGLAFYNRIYGSGTEMGNAAKCFQEAVKLDPRFMLAWARLSRSLGSLYPNYGSGKQEAEAIRDAADTAVRLQPEAEEAVLARAYYKLGVKRDYAAARIHFEQARRIAPNSGEAPSGLAQVALAQGRWNEYLPCVREARRLDPRNAALWVVEARFCRWTKQ